MQRITTHLWFDTQAKEAAEFYTSLFKDARITSTTQLHNTPSGSVDVVSIDLAGQQFALISAGPLFKFNPSISFLIACQTKEEVADLWEKLSKDGTVLMELNEYPFSEKYGWTQDRYGLSWQIMYVGETEIKQKITPTLMFVGDVCGKAEEAVNFYTSVFNNSKVGDILRYEAGEEPDKKDTIKHVAFTLENQEFAAMDSAREHKFAFNEAISFLINCYSQDEIEYYWNKLTSVPESEQCGWLKDKYGVSWQVIPIGMEKLLNDPDKQKVDRVTQAFLKMKKIDLATLEKVANEK